MKTSRIFNNTQKIMGRAKLQAFLFFVLIAVAGCVHRANAQRNNLSDWNVPPPLSPGNITKSGNTGKSATEKPILIITDAQTPSQPDATAVQLPYLAMATIPPGADIPNQPAMLDINPALPELPLPEAPDTPTLPKQHLQDTPIQQLVDLPMPDLPEMPALPAEPTSSGPVTATKATNPVMPDVIGITIFSIPGAAGLNLWSTPAIPENVNFRLATVPATKAAKYRGNEVKKVKSQLQKN